MKILLMIRYIHILLFVLIGACKTTGSSLHQDDESRATIKQMLDTALPVFCQVAADEIKSEEGFAEDKRSCDKDLIEGVCSQQQMSAQAAIESLLKGPEVEALTSNRQNRQNLAKDIYKSLEEAAYRCINSGAEYADRLVEEIRQDPIYQERLKDGRKRFWDVAQRAIARGIVRGTQGYRAGNFRGSMQRMILAGICYAGFKAAENFYEASDKIDTDHCDVTEADVMRQKKACMASAGSACAAAGGFVDIQKWPGMKTENDVLKFMQNATSVGIELACQRGGPVISVSCGVINQSLNQIRQAIETGTNDWAECTGVTAYYGCLGQKWGERGWSNKKGVREAYYHKKKQEFLNVKTGNVEQGEETWLLKDCCWCREVFYKDRSFWRSTYLGAVNKLTVLQKGKFETGNCQELANRGKYREAIKVSHFDFVKFEYCKSVTIIGSRCSLWDPKAKKPRNLPYWDHKKNSPSGRVLLHPKADPKAPSFIKNGKVRRF